MNQFSLNSFKLNHTLAHFPSKSFSGKSKFGKYGDCVMEMDYGVGKILDLLQQINVKDNTFVYFSSDNGGHLEETDLNGHQEGGYNGIYKGMHSLYSNITY
jgi:arylsulfatase A-like enzyme